jgi:hypothetical protein
MGLTRRDRKRVERRHIEHINVNVIARSTLGNPSLMLGEGRQERTIGRDVVVANASRRELGRGIGG